MRLPFLAALFASKSEYVAVSLNCGSAYRSSRSYEYRSGLLACDVAHDVVVVVTCRHDFLVFGYGQSGRQFGFACIQVLDAIDVERTFGRVSYDPGDPDVAKIINAYLIGAQQSGERRAVDGNLHGLFVLARCKIEDDYASIVVGAITFGDCRAFGQQYASVFDGQCASLVCVGCVRSFVVLGVVQCSAYMPKVLTCQAVNGRVHGSFDAGIRHRG